MSLLTRNPRIFPSGAQVVRLADGRLHFHHGPIDIIAQAWGDPAAVKIAEEMAANRFANVLSDLCQELGELRSEYGVVTGPVAKAMEAAVRPFRPEFITPMAAVAGAVADWLIQDFRIDGIERAYVNNGGDIAVHLAPGQSLTCAIAARAGVPDRLTIDWTDTFRGIATSGWSGRSWSFGIADAVTVAARTAAMADAAATMIANAVDLPGHPKVKRRPAVELQADSDLGHRQVTVDVPELSAMDRRCALDRGLEKAMKFQSSGLIEAAALYLQGDVCTTTAPGQMIKEG